MSLVLWPLRHFATHRAKPISKSIKDDLLRSHERTTCLPQQIGPQRPLQDVISTALMPYKTGERRFAVSGPPLVVKSRQALSLSLAIHELATNALKYGALAVETGHVSITWTSEDQDGEPKFVFVWQEIGGPPVSEPTRVGFGSRLISRVLQDDFRGSVEMSYGSAGLTCRLTALLEDLEVPQNNA